MAMPAASLVAGREGVLQDLEQARDELAGNEALGIEAFDALASARFKQRVLCGTVALERCAGLPQGVQRPAATEQLQPYGNQRGAFSWGDRA